MLQVNLLDKQEFHTLAAEIFAILADNMSQIAPTENSREEDYRIWCRAMAEGLQAEQRKLALLYDNTRLAGYFQYSVFGTVFRMEEIQIIPTCQGAATQAFRLLLGFALSALEPGVKTVEAYANKSNEKSQGILRHMGLQIIGENKTGSGYRFQGEMQSLLSWYHTRIRRADKADLARLTDIYNQAICSKKATADVIPFTPEQREQWFLEHCRQERTPVYVYVDNAVVVGYCYLSPYRPGRQALESAAEISYYIDYAYHGMGIGSELIQHTIEQAKGLGYRSLIAILLSCNEASAALLKKYGFALWGTLPDIVFMEGQVYSHLYYGRHI